MTTSPARIAWLLALGCWLGFEFGRGWFSGDRPKLDPVLLVVFIAAGATVFSFG